MEYREALRRGLAAACSVNITYHNIEIISVSVVDYDSDMRKRTLFSRSFLGPIRRTLQSSATVTVDFTVRLPQTAATCELCAAIRAAVNTNSLDAQLFAAEFVKAGLGEVEINSLGATLLEQASDSEDNDNPDIVLLVCIIFVLLGASITAAMRVRASRAGNAPAVVAEGPQGRMGAPRRVEVERPGPFVAINFEEGTSAQDVIGNTRDGNEGKLPQTRNPKGMIRKHRGSSSSQSRAAKRRIGSQIMVDPAPGRSDAALPQHGSEVQNSAPLGAASESSLTKAGPALKLDMEPGLTRKASQGRDDRRSTSSKKAGSLSTAATGTADAAAPSSGEAALTSIRIDLRESPRELPDSAATRRKGKSRGARLAQAKRVTSAERVLELALGTQALPEKSGNFATEHSSDLSGPSDENWPEDGHWEAAGDDKQIQEDGRSWEESGEVPDEGPVDVVIWDVAWEQDGVQDGK